VSDLVRGLMNLMESGDSGPINLGNPHEVTVLELAKKLLAMIPGTGSAIEFRPLPQDDPIRRRPDITKAGAILGWKPKVHLDEGLKATIDYFRAELV